MGLARRPFAETESLIRTVSPIIEEVKRNGDDAVRKYSEKFDGVRPDPVGTDPENCSSVLPAEQSEALELAARNVFRFHREQVVPSLSVETMPGIECRKETRPIERVGLYIPGGTAPLPSTAIMLGIPATVAGCQTIVLATPPGENGEIPPSIAWVAKKIGAKTVVRAGGAQAIAAMAYGTETVPKVDKIFGPGNRYVTAAKMALQQSDAMVSIDLPAGPSEVLVIADSGADPRFIAADLLSQAEHGPDSQVVLAAIDGFNTDVLLNELELQTAALPRSAIARQALEESFVLEVGSPDEAIAFSNLYAPEHLILNTADAADLAEKVQHAGSVFIGPWTPESLGDYASGTNHTLPTYGYARMYSGVSLQSFQKSITFQTATSEGLWNLGPTVVTLAEMEGLQAHARAVSIRLEKLEAEVESSKKRVRNKRSGG